MTTSLSNDVIRISPILTANESTINTSSATPKNTFPTWKQRIGRLSCWDFKSHNECDGGAIEAQSAIRGNCNTEDETLPLNRSNDKRLNQNEETAEKYNYMELKSDYLKGNKGG